MAIADFLFASGLIWIFSALFGIIKYKSIIVFTSPQVGGFVGEPGLFMVMLGFLLMTGLIDPTPNPPLWSYVLMAAGVIYYYLSGLTLLRWRISKRQSLEIPHLVKIVGGPGTFLLGCGWILYVL